MVTVVVAGWAEWITKKQPSSLCERRTAVGFREEPGGFFVVEGDGAAKRGGGLREGGI